MNPQITIEQLTAAFLEQITYLSTQLALSKAEASAYLGALRHLHDEAVRAENQAKPENESEEA